jgi:hypothetical protein
MLCLRHSREALVQSLRNSLAIGQAELSTDFMGDLGYFKSGLGISHEAMIIL